MSFYQFFQFCQLSPPEVGQVIIVRESAEPHGEIQFPSQTARLKPRTTGHMMSSGVAAGKTFE